MVNYPCKACTYETSIKTHWNRHIETAKHIRNVEEAAKKEAEEAAKIVAKPAEIREILKPISYMRTMMKDVMTIDSTDRIPMFYHQLNNIREIVNDGDRSLLCSSSTIVKCMTEIFRRSLKAAGGVGKYPIVCVDKKRTRLFFHMEYPDGEIEWVEDEDYKLFTVVVCCAIGSVILGTTAEREELGLGEKENYISHYLKKKGDKCDISKHLNKIMFWNYKGIRKVEDMSASYCYTNMLTAFCDIFCINNLVTDYNNGENE